jgi:hypothetical protein
VQPSVRARAIRRFFDRESEPSVDADELTVDCLLNLEAIKPLLLAPLWDGDIQLSDMREQF